MRLRDIQNQTAWMKKCQVEVITVGEPEPSQYGFCQVIDIKDGQGVEACLNVFLDDLAGMVQDNETGEQYYDILWDRGKEYYKARPALAPPKENLNATANKPTDWAAKDRRIAKMSCIKSAASLYVGREGYTVDDIIGNANKFYDWIYE